MAAVQSASTVQPTICESGNSGAEYPRAHFSLLMVREIIADVLASIFLSDVIAILFLDWLDWRSRLRDFGVKGISSFLSPDILWSTAWLFYMAVTFLRAPGGSSPKPVGWAGWMLFLSVFICSITISVFWARFTPGPKAHLLSRGLLRERVHLLARQAGITTTGQYTWGTDQFNVCVLPEGYRRWFTLVPRFSLVTIAFPARFLERLSCSEIDALAARQLARSRRKSRIPMLIIISAYAAAAVLLFHVLRIAPTQIPLGVIFLLAVEIAALALYWPVLELRYDVEAVRITSDPESFISALARLAEVGGRRLQQRARRLAKRIGIPENRFQELWTAETRSVENRYPTTGDYFVTGL